MTARATPTPSGDAAAAPRLLDGVRAAAPLAVGPLLFGASFGLLAGEAGMGTLAALVMSATTFAGSAQFAAAGTLEAGGGAFAAVAAAALLNGRYLPMGVAAAGAFAGRTPQRRLVEAQLIVDESWAIAGRSGRFDRPVLLGAGLLLYVCWVGGTVAGALFGDVLGDPEALGLDAAFPALFLALLWPYTRARAGRTTAVLGGLVALALVPVAPPGVPIVAAALVCLLGLAR